MTARRRLPHGRPTLRADLPQQNDKVLLKRIAAQAAAIRFFAANGKQKQIFSHCIHIFFLCFGGVCGIISYTNHANGK